MSKTYLDALWGTDHLCLQISNNNYLAPKNFLDGKHFYPQFFTDAPDTHWCAALANIPHNEIKTDIENQRHEQLAFLSGSVT